jgi:DNA-binding LacI/PurR family transcriptional regulator
MLNEHCDATAVQCVNDLVAIGCAETLLGQGVNIPGDISIVGFGNVLIAEHFRVPLTTISQPKFRLGIAAMDVMLKLMHNERVEPRRMPAELIVRETTARPPATPQAKKAEPVKLEALL